MSFKNYEKLDKFFDCHQLSNIKVNFDKKECFIRLQCHGNNKSLKFSQCYNNLKEISGHFKVNFSIENFESLKYYMRLKDAEYIENYLLKLNKNYEIYFFEWYQSKKDLNPPAKINIIDEISKAKKENKKDARLRKFKNDLFNNCALIMPRNKEILNDFNFNNDDLTNLVRRLNNPDSCKEVIKFLLENKDKFKKNYYSTISENYNFENLTQCAFIENFYSIPKNNQSYNRLKNLSIFNSLGENLTSEVIND